MMACTAAQKVSFDDDILAEEAEDWLDNARIRLEVVGTKVT